MMKCRLKLTIRLQSDFHSGTGTGRGRTVDAQVLKDQNGCPYLLGSSIKGLARDHAEHSVIPIFSEFDPELVDFVFGREGNRRGWFHFEDARLESGKTVSPPIVVGRSARDRTTGSTLRSALFFNEVAAGTTFPAFVEADAMPDEPVSLKAVVLLLLSLRRIEALGASRRRGLGKCSVEVEVLEGPECLAGTKLPLSPELPAADTDWLTTVWRKIESYKADAAPSSGVFSAPLPADQKPAALPLIAQAVTPLVFAADQGIDNIIGSLDYVPGSTVRGAVAHWLLRQNVPAGGDVFQRLIAHEELRFGPLYPLSSDWSRDKSTTMPFPTPFSLLQCKAAPGELRRPELRTSEAHGVVDRLYHPDCDACGCGDSLVACSGWGNIYQPDDQEREYQLRLWDAKQQTTQRTAIDSEITQRAKPENLFATEAIPEGTWFAGYIWGPQWAIDLLTQRLFDTMQTFRVGKSQTRGHGKLCVWMERLGDETDEYKRHRDAVYPLLCAEGQLASAPVHGFSLTCYSDLIAVDSLLTPITRMTASDLWEMLPHTTNRPCTVPFRGAAAYVRTVRTSGFNGQVGLPRTADVALAAGSCWRFEWSTSDQAARDYAWKLLLQAHRDGLGLRRGDGFGRIVLNLPVHLAMLNQVQHGGEPGAQRLAHAAFTVCAQAGPFPNRHVGSQMRSGRLRPDWQGSERRKARQLADKCAPRVRSTAARSLWQLGQALDPGAQLASAAAELINAAVRPYPLPAEKPDSTREQLGKFLQDVARTYERDAPNRQKMAEWLRLTAEYLQALADQS